MDQRLILCLLLMWAAAEAARRPAYSKNEDSSDLFRLIKDSVRSRHKRQTAGCGNVVLTVTSQGELTTPGYPQQYPVNDVCKWRIQAPQGQRIQLTFVTFDVEDSDGCQYDSLKVFNGGGSQAPRMASVCGQQLPTNLLSSTNRLFLKFTSDITDVGTGFKISVTFIGGGGSGGGSGLTTQGPTAWSTAWPTAWATAATTTTGSGGGSGSTVCGTAVPITSESQNIVPPFNLTATGQYQNNLHCSWGVQAPGGKRVKLTKTPQSTFAVENSPGCVYDYVAVYDGENENALILGRFCGDNFPGAGIESSGNGLFIVFHTDTSLADSGFRLSLQFISPDVAAQNCGGTMTGSSGQVTTPNYGYQNYPNNAECTWVIDVGHNKLVKLEFSSFRVEDGPNCMYDSVNIYDGQSKASPKLGSFCGNTAPGLIESTGKYLLVEFLSDGSIKKPGFAASYTTITQDEGPKETPGCGASRPAVLQEAEGRISSPSSMPSRNYPDNSLCQWRITVADGKRAHLRVDSFSLEEAGSCQYDHLEVYDGADGSSTKLGRYCGNNIPGDITATANIIFLQFTSDSSVSGTGFNITYSAKDAGGNTLPGGNGNGNGNGDEPACGIPEVQPKFGRIVGGTEATAHSWPWQVSLRRGGHICGASIISRKYVVTAAHCIHGGSASEYTIVVGEHDRKTDENTEQTINVAAIIEHEAYNSNTVENDIAVLRLSEDIRYSPQVKPVCLPRGDAAPDMSCITTGWGSTEGTGDDTVLNQVRIPILDRAQCQAQDWYGSSFTSAMICAGYPEGGKDSCQGDSGGPLVCRENGVFRLQGITSWGFGCAQAKKPGIYTRVARFVDWVDSKTAGAFQAPA